MQYASQTLIRKARSFQIDDVDQLAATYGAAPIEYMQLTPGRLGARVHAITTPRLEIREASFGADLLIAIDTPPHGAFGLGVAVAGDVQMQGARLTSSNVGYTNGAQGSINVLRHEPAWCSVAIDRTLLQTIAEVHHHEVPARDGSRPLPTRTRASLAARLGRIARGEQLQDLAESQLEEHVALLVLRHLNEGARCERIDCEQHRRIVHEVLDFVRAAYADRITMTQLCELVKVSERSLQYVFRGATGMSVQQYLKRYRVHRARELLVSGEAETVREAALACGIPHAARFSQYYREQFGESPRNSMAAT
jgi:AraC-like DNA-binding protein